MSPRSFLLALGFLAALFAIFVPLALRVNGGRDRTIDGERLRRTYVALSLYESEHDESSAPNVALVRQDLDPSDFQSVADPRREDPGPFALDPFVPDLHIVVPTRVSWSYRRHWPEAKGDVPLDRRQGLLADPWLGLRVTEDGALVEGSKGPDFSGLFGN